MDVLAANVSDHELVSGAEAPLVAELARLLRFETLETDTGVPLNIGAHPGSDASAAENLVAGAGHHGVVADHHVAAASDHHMGTVGGYGITGVMLGDLLSSSDLSTASSPSPAAQVCRKLSHTATALGIRHVWPINVQVHHGGATRSPQLMRTACGGIYSQFTLCRRLAQFLTSMFYRGCLQWQALTTAAIASGPGDISSAPHHHGMATILGEANPYTTTVSSERRYSAFLCDSAAAVAPVGSVCSVDNQSVFGADPRPTPTPGLARTATAQSIMVRFTSPPYSRFTRLLILSIHNGNYAEHDRLLY